MDEIDIPVEVANEPEVADFWRPLLHRWFVEYNPLYLLSALLVLVGLTLVARSPARPSLDAEVGASAIVAELYAGGLIAGAALLTRIRLRRPAVLLGLLAIVYQGDLTLLTERSAYLGLLGDVAVVVWLGLFVAKLGALAWALRLRLSRSAVTAAAIGALGVAVLPRLLDRVGSGAQPAVAMLVAFAALAPAVWTTRSVTSTEDLDGWGRTVLARATRASWWILGSFLVAHVAFSCVERHVALTSLSPALLALSIRFVRRERVVWCAGALALGAAAWTPATLSAGALVVAAALALRAFRAPGVPVERRAPVQAEPPYRTQRVHAPPAPVPPGPVFTLAPRAARLRLLTGAMFAAHASAWTWGWTGGPWPAHRLALDVALGLVVALFVWRLRGLTPVAPLALTYLDLAVRAGLVSAPATTLQWGVSAVSVGFGLLVTSLAVSVWLRPRPVPSPAPSS